MCPSNPFLSANLIPFHKKRDCDNCCPASFTCLGLEVMFKSPEARMHIQLKWWCCQVRQDGPGWQFFFQASEVQNKLKHSLRCSVPPHRVSGGLSSPGRDIRLLSQIMPSTLAVL